MSSDTMDLLQAANGAGRTEGEERRKFRRIASTATFSFYPLDEWGSTSYPATSVDTSPGGLSFQTSRKVEVGSLIILRLKIIDLVPTEHSNRMAATNTESRIIAAANVLRVRRTDDGGYFVAVKFDFDTYIESDKEEVKIIFQSVNPDYS